MSDLLFKDKKKKTYTKKSNTKIKTTIDNRHNQKLTEITELEKTITEKNNLLEKAKIQLEVYNQKEMKYLSDKEISLKLELIENIKNLKKEIESIKNNEMKNSYILQTSHLLYEYFDENRVFKESDSLTNTSSKKKTVLDFFGPGKKTKPKKNVNKNDISSYSSKNAIMDQYLQITDDSYIKNINNIPNDELDNCLQCNVPRILDSSHGCMICPKCGCEEKILVDYDTPSYKEPPRELTYFAYKKINHANEWLSQFQAKESTDISEEIFEKIMNELKKETYINLKTLTVEKVRDILKKLDLTKYYEHCHYITNRITGKPAPVITGDLEEKVRNMFKEIQGPWMKYCPSDRSNFFSYPYIFYKFFQLLDKDEYLPYCRLLKSREKLQEHDEVWKQICKDLKWQYIPTV
tara:strand:+ start:1962 stop:3182 length:1221 start_codon:yes stop_codon:yes gene_type:complete